MSSIIKKKKALLIGIAGSYNAFSLSLYNLKSYAYLDKEVEKAWDILVIQHPLINQDALSGNFNEDINKLSCQIIYHKPDLIGFSCYLWNVKAFKQLGCIVRQELFHTKILWGGQEITTDYIVEGKYNDFEADFIISGEGERTFYELLKNLDMGDPKLPKINGLSFRNGKGNFTVNEKRVPFKSLSEIPSPYLNGCVDEEVLARKNVEANLETQRGCSLRCSYCIYHKDMSRISYNIIERVLDEVVFICSRGVKKLRFVDANFSSELDHAKAIMRGLIGRNIEAKIMFELIPGFIDEELAQLLAQYNALHDWNELTLGVGVQTINLEVLRRMRRGIPLSVFEKTFDLLERYGIYTKIDLIIGLPGEDIKSISRMLEYFMDRLRNSHAHLLCCHVMRGLPGTELLDIAKEYNMFFSSEREPHELIESTILPRADMLKCLRRTGVVFRLVNHAGWTSKEFIGDKSLNDVSIRDSYFMAKDRLGISNIELIDILIEKLMVKLSERKSCFSHPEFPYAETWWWARSQFEISNKWLIQNLDALQKEDVRALKV